MFKVYKLVIIDDKSNVIEGIRRFGNWAEREIEVVGSASDGLEALQLIERVRPDIALTDIAMPLLDGLEFTEKARQILPHLKIIVLSGYDQFEYARQALRLGVMDYLLKPVKIEQIIAAVERAKVTLQLEEKTKEELQVLKRYTRQNEWVQEVDRFLDEPERWAALCQAESEEVVRRLGLVKWPPALRLILFSPPGLLSLLERFWQQTENPERLIVTKDHYGMTLGTEAEVIRFTEALADEHDKNFYLVLSRPASHPRALPELYNELLSKFKLIEFNAVEIPGLIVRAEQLTAPSLTYPLQLEHEIIQSVGLGLAELIPQQVKKFYLEAGQGDLLDPAAARAFGLRLLAECTQVLARYGYEGQTPHLYELQVDEGWQRADLEDHLSTLISRQAEYVAVQRQAKNKSSVEQAVDFIKENLHKELSLDDVAAHLHFTPSYLANLFKRTTGETVVEYIVRLKMERAAELVLDPDIKIAAIAQNLGYSDRRYFSELFRRKFGCTPSEYREKFWLGRR